LTTTGDSGASTYNNTTGVINVPNYTLAGLGGISYTSLSGGTGITYNNTTGAISYSGTVYTDASVRALISATGNISYNSTTGVISTSLTQYTDALARASVSLTTTGTSGASTYNSTTGVLNVPQYQGAITLTTTGTSGAATFSSGTLNIPQYAAALSGTTNYHAKFTSSTTIGNSLIFDNGTNIGVGTTSPSTKLTILSTDSAKILLTGGTTQNGILLDSVGTSAQYYYGAGNNLLVGGDQGTLVAYNVTSGLSAIFFDSSNNIRFGVTTSTERMRINSNGTVAIGTTANNYKLQVSDTLDTWIRVINTTGGGYAAGFRLKAGGDNEYGFFGGDNNCGIRDFTNSATRLQVFANGNIAIATTSDNGYKLYVSGTIYATGNITANSDLTLKKNLELITNPTDKLMKLNGYSYQWKSDDSHQYGVIAQEVEKILPYAVSTGNDGIKGVSYNQIIPVLIEAVKEQKAKIENLEILLASK
jgi:hypothetical protein